MTFEELQNTTFQLLRDAAKTKYNAVYIKQYLNEAERQFCSITEYSVKKDTSIVTVENQIEYEVPDDYKNEIMLFYQNSPLFKTDIQTTLLSGEYSSPSSYYIRNNYIGLYPTPTTSGDTITLVYRSIGGAMTNISDTPIIPVEHHRLLVFYACYMCCIEGDDVRANIFKSEWEQGLLRGNLEVINKVYGDGFPVVGEDYIRLDPIDHDLSGF